MNESNHIPSQSYEPLRRILSSDRIKELQSKIKINFDAETIDWQEQSIPLKEIEKSYWEPKLIIAIDGDYSKSVISNGFPGAEVGYITVSTVVILLDKVKELQKDKFIDPKKFRETEKPTSIDSLFVGCNVVLENDDSAKSSMRRILYEEMKKNAVFQETETLLETYEALLQIKRERQSSSNVSKCPHDDCDADLKEGYGEYYCDNCGGKLFSTDALRLHELMNPSGTNGEMYGQIKETFKKLQLIHLIRSFEKKNEWFGTLRDIAFFLEGSLTVFSAASWLAKCIKEELERINKKVAEACGQDLLILGIERTGNFVNHFADIDTKTDGTKDNFPNQAVFLPTNDYIKRNIVLNENPDYIYLKDTAFGRKFFYKTHAGYRVLPSVATFNSYQTEPTTAFPAQYPRLGDCLALLDKLVSSRYENSVMPLATAHAEASIPLNIGKKIFDDIAKKIQSN